MNKKGWIAYFSTILLCTIFAFGLTIFLLGILVKPTCANQKSTNDFYWFWLFYEHEINQRFETNVYRPFYLKTQYKDGLVFRAFLLPLYWQYTTERKNEKKVLFGLWNSTTYLHPGGREDYDLSLFPLFYGF